MRKTTPEFKTRLHYCLRTSAKSDADRRVKKFANRADRLIRRRLVVFEPMSQKFGGRRPRRIEGVIGAGIDHEPDRRATIALLPGYSPIVQTVQHLAALVRRRPIVKFAGQDQGGNGHVVPERPAGRIESDHGAELVGRCLLDNAAFDRRQRQPATLREADGGNARGVDEWLLHQKAQRPVGIECQIDRSAVVAGLLEAARTEAVDGERHIAPGCDLLSPALVEPPPVSVAAMQQHDGGGGAVRWFAAAGPAAAAGWRAGSRIRRRSQTVQARPRACDGASDQKRGNTTATICKSFAKAP